MRTKWSVRKTWQVLFGNENKCVSHIGPKYWDPVEKRSKRKCINMHMFQTSHSLGHHERGTIGGYGTCSGLPCRWYKETKLRDAG